MKYIIEHLEPELSKWCMIEYKHISQTVGKENIIFSNITEPSLKLKPFGEIKEESVNEIQPNNACILDPRAEKTLSPDDTFDYLIFGGILGDDPPQDRTAEITIQAEKRNLGNKQMSTNTAVLVAKKISEGKPLEKLEFEDEIEIPMKDGESVILPFRYLIENHKPVLPEGLKQMLKDQDEF
jgi:ribosome biogenesis SPOUT family RNA methylase Rps3|tara:strand:+ start:505 stop:1050 length:546 start_codon:yes stop_codon:yes gene_type:complete